MGSDFVGSSLVKFPKKKISSTRGETKTLVKRRIEKDSEASHKIVKFIAEKLLSWTEFFVRASLADLQIAFLRLNGIFAFGFLFTFLITLSERVQATEAPKRSGTGRSRRKWDFVWRTAPTIRSMGSKQTQERRMRRRRQKTLRNNTSLRSFEIFFLFSSHHKGNRRAKMSLTHIDFRARGLPPHLKAAIMQFLMHSTFITLSAFPYHYARKAIFSQTFQSVLVSRSHPLSAHKSSSKTSDRKKSPRSSTKHEKKRFEKGKVRYGNKVKLTKFSI